MVMLLSSWSFCPNGMNLPLLYSGGVGTSTPCLSLHLPLTTTVKKSYGSVFSAVAVFLFSVSQFNVL